MQIEGLDELDNRILTVIEKNARLSFSEIGQQVGLSRVSVRKHMENMERQGIIQGYETRINPTALPEGRRFFIDVVTEPEQFEKVVETLVSSEIIRRAYAVTGECRIKLEGFAANNMEYEMFMRYARRHMNGIRSITVQDAQYIIKDVDGGVDYAGNNKEGQRQVQ